jgi:hypothetical protein
LVEADFSPIIVPIKKSIPMKNSFFTILLGMTMAFTLSLASCSNKTTETTPPVASNPSETAPETVVEEPAATSNTVKGTFVALEMGDYMHFNMKSDAGEDLSFWVMDLSADQIAPFEEGGMEGKKIEVTWEKTMADIPESGGKMEIEEVTAIKILE